MSHLNEKYLSERWHKAGWEDGVRHERERSKVLVEALKKIARHICDDDFVDANIIVGTVMGSLKKFEEVKP